MNNSFVAVIGDRNVGKTTYLWNVYISATQAGKRILVIDSATEHVDKSLFVKIKENEQNCIIIPRCDEKLIVYPNINKASYPLGNILLGQKLYLCDSSYYLEKGYDFPEGEEREECRKRYKYYSIQVALLLMDEVDVFIWDEIELMPEFRDAICKLKKNKKELYMALHKEEGLAGLDELFKIERI